MGVQFAPAAGYQQIFAGGVWDLYRADYPQVEEHPPLASTFETFGTPFGAPGNLGFFSGLMHDRYWFLSANKDELIQFQADRLLHNWRKIGDMTNEYPRFERMVEKFEQELKTLEGYFLGFGAYSLSCNQVEISYVNHIRLSQDGEFSKTSGWLNFINFGVNEPDDISMSSREVIRDDKGQPQGRLICELASTTYIDGQKILILTLMTRGKPAENTIDSAIDFLHQGRDLIVKKFASVTTPSAHALWERVR